jgi:urea carboxylase
VLAEPGTAIQAGETVMIIESMKMEVRISAPVSGVVKTILVTPGQTTRPGQRLGTIIT